MSVITTFLEMRSRPSLSVPRPFQSGMLLRLDPPTTGFYRYLYETVGSRWGWKERVALNDEELLAVIADPGLDVFVLYMGGVPAGMFELDRRVEGEVELRHFGLAPDYIERGLGKYLLYSAVESAWDHEPERVWVRSTSLEHPRGLLVYQWVGFEPYDSVVE
jgi:GNAT superfamily N-acetyltransferase